MTWFWLRFLDLLRPLYEWQGVDFYQLRSIVGIKLEMDNRRAPAFRTRVKKQHAGSFIGTLIFYGLFGALLSMLIAYVPSIIFSFSIFHSFLIVMITLTLVSDFSAVLLDTSDNTIILPRPISPKTFYAARTTHILLYIGQISLGLSIVPIVVTFVVYGTIVGLVVILTTILTVIFSVSLTNGLYLLMMRFTSEERLKSIINYFQIIMVILMMAAYQILPRLLNIADLANMSTELEWWSVFIPPMWMAGLVSMVHDLNFQPLYLIAAFLAVVVPVTGWKAINKYLTPYFTEKLADLGTSTAPAQVTTAQTSAKKSRRLQIGTWITRAGLERATFTLVSLAFSRDRKLKLRIYPAIGSFVVIIAVMILRNAKGGVSVAEYIQSLAETETHIFIIYACIFILVTVAFEINFSDEYKASWIFQSAPVQKPGEILLGTIKAILVGFFIPVFSIAGIGILIVWGQRAVVDLIFGMFSCVLLMLTLFVMVDKHMPLSIETTARTQGGSLVRSFLSLIAIGAVGAAHYFLTKADLFLWLACPLMLAACFGVAMVYRRVAWDDIHF
jgi:ABC-2 type transport system permease protein